MFNTAKYLEYLKHINNEESSFRGEVYLDSLDKVIGYKIPGDLPKSISEEYELINDSLIMWNNQKADLHKKELILKHYTEFTI